MAEDGMWKEKYTKLKERYTKLEEGRNALRQGLSIFEQQISKIQAENLALKKAYEDEKARADSQKAEKESESVMRVSLENEVSALKSEIQTLQENGVSDARNLNGEVLRLEQHISEREKEIHKLKGLLEKERVRADAEKKRADSEKKKADTERKKVDEALNKLKGEKNRVKEDKRLADVERKKAEEYRVQLEALKMEIDEVKSNLVLEKSNFEQTKRELEDERSHLSKEKKRADLALAKAKEQRKLAEANGKMAMNEKSHAEFLSKQLEEKTGKIAELEKEISELVSFKKLVDVFGDQPGKQILSGKVEGTTELCGEMSKREVTTPELGSDLLKSEKQHRNQLMEAQEEIIKERKCAESEVKKAKQHKKVAKSCKKKAEDEKDRVDKLYREVADNKCRIEEMQGLIEKLVSSRTHVKTSLPAPNKSSQSESGKVKLLKEKLKFEKMLVKHAKQVAGLEVARNHILRQELRCLKQEFLQLSQHLDILDTSVFSSGEDIYGLEKLGGSNLKRKHSHGKPHQMHLLTEKEVLKPASTGRTAADGSHSFKLSVKPSGFSIPVKKGSHTESTSGIDSKLEPPHRGSNQKMLQSSAINSSSASFSDRPLVGSQEGGAFSVTTSAKFVEENSNLEPSVSRLSDGTRKNCCNDLLAIADNGIKKDTHVLVVQEKTDSDRNKELLDAVESTENLYSKDQKWHWPVAKNLSVLHGVWNTKIDQLPTERGYSISDMHGHEDVRCYKRRKISCEEEMTGHLCDSREPESTLNTSSIEESDISKQAPPSKYPSESVQAWKDQIDEYFCNRYLPGSFHELAEEDYMKLLDLDNDVDEKSYRAAVERPLSPTLPEIEFNKSVGLEVDNSKHFLVDSFSKEISDKDNVRSGGSFEAMELEIDSNNNLKPNGLGDSTISRLQEQKGVNNSIKNLVDNENDKSNIAQVGYPILPHIHDSGGELTMPALAVSGKVSNISRESAFASSKDMFPRYCIVFPDIRDFSSISRIFGAIHTFKSQCSIISSSDFLLDILVALMKAEDLSSREKVCTFVSLLLENICNTERTFKDVLDGSSLQCVDILCHKVNAAFSHKDTREILVKLWDLHDLLDLIEDFILNRRVLVYGRVSSESTDILVLNGNDAMLSVQVAPSCLLVAGGLLLASICSSIDHIGFICEASCNIIRFQKLDTSVVLMILHLFAYVCGARYFAQEGYALAMIVVRSLVVYLEKLKFSDDTASSLSSLVDTPCKLWSCSNCPFLEDASSTSSVVSLLLEELHNYIIAAFERQNHVELVCPSKAGAKSNKADYVKAVPSDEFANGDLCRLLDILSLVELVACFMNWESSFENIVCPLLKMLESCPVEHLSVAIIILLGQLGRFGIDTDGYENTKVDTLRGQLSSFLSQNGTRKLGFFVQLASATALISLMPCSFEELVNGDAKIPATADCIKKWFSSLSNEQQSVFRSELSSTLAVSKTGYLAATTVLLT